MLTCTWAPTTFAGTAVAGGTSSREAPAGPALVQLLQNHVARVESLGLTHLLIAQRWWGNAKEIEGASLDCLAMTAAIATMCERLHLVTAVHPGFLEPAQVAKWGASVDQLVPGRWSINVTSGWNLEEFAMYGVDPLEHDGRYERASEFIEVLRGAWSGDVFSYTGQHYQVQNLQLQPRPAWPLTVFQGGQSDAAVDMAVAHSDWMFLNGGSIEKIRATIERVRARTTPGGRTPRFAVYGIPLCRPTDAEAWAEIEARLAGIDEALLARRRERVAGAEGMWAGADRLGMLDTNEGYSTGLIGSPETILARLSELRAAGVDMMHLMLGDPLFEEAVLPQIAAL